MITPAQVITEARTWLDVRTFHKGRTREGGVDCLGLILVTGWALDAIPPRSAIVIPDYGRLPNSHRLVSHMDANALRLDQDAAGPGDVVGFAWGSRGNPMHLGFVSSLAGRRTLIHASPHDRRVVEHGLAGAWAANLCAAWRFRSLAV